jgi:hypothetical protein
MSVLAVGVGGQLYNDRKKSQIYFFILIPVPYGQRLRFLSPYV